jgi:TolA-binding protein
MHLLSRKRLLTLDSPAGIIHMRILAFSAFLLISTGLLAFVQEGGDVDPVTKQATQLESQLTKTRSTTAEAAEVMLKLIDLYHENGRVFGLVRVGQSFVALHTTHPRHKDAMVKLMDGLRVTGRNKELIATARQFLVRYPSDAAGADAEKLLARLLGRSNETAAAAAVNEAVWKRLGATPEGREHGLRALAQYQVFNNADGWNKAGTIGDDLLDKLPAGAHAAYAGWQAVDAWERISNWPKANVTAGKLLAKGGLPGPYYLQTLHHRMGENYSRQGQRVNAIESFKKAIAVQGMPANPGILGRVIGETYGTNPKPPVLEPLVAEYLQKYPERTDRHQYRTTLAILYLNDKQPAKAEQILTEILPFDARSHNPLHYYFQVSIGDTANVAAAAQTAFVNADKAATVAETAAKAAAADPKQKDQVKALTDRATTARKQADTLKAEMDRTATLAQAKFTTVEKVLTDAIAKSTPFNAAPLRYALALDFYRDRVRDLAKAKTAAREALYKNQTNENYTATYLNWLLDNAASDAEFQGDVAAYVAARKEKPYWANYREALAAWLQANGMKKEPQIVSRVSFARARLAEADKDPVFADWLALEKAGRENNIGQVLAIRARLLAPASTAKLPDELCHELFYNQQYYYRHHIGAPQNATSVDICKAWTQRLPKSIDAAWNYIAWTTDFGTVKEYADAAKHYMTFNQEYGNSDAYRRVFQCVGGSKDAALGKQAWAWLQKNIDKYGYDGNNSASIGDYLEALGMKDEALAIWKKGLVANRDNHDSRQCFDRLTARLMNDADKLKLLDEQLPIEGYWQFNYAILKGDRLLKANDLAGFEKLLRETAEKGRNRPFYGWNPNNDYTMTMAWVANVRADMKMPEADKRRIYTLLRDLRIERPSASAAVALLELTDEQKMPPMKRLLALNEATLMSYGDHVDWDAMMGYAQTAMSRKDYLTSATILGGILANQPTVDEGRRKSGRDMLTQAYSRMGAAGSAIDDKSPIAPLLQAGMHLRLGDNKLAFETYLANKKLFDDHKTEVPLDLLLFVCESHMAAGGDENANRVEDICRAWLIKHSENKEIEDSDKARVQLMLGRNYFKARRYDLARNEFTTTVNRYPKTAQATEADFGIGETHMEQKVYDQAESVFERLAGSRERDVVIRAEFLRGVLASRRGDRDDARLIFRGVLERVPTIELANQVLFNLSEVYGAEQRYVDQLELLRTVGRLGRNSKRWHTPGEPLSIVVQDSDLGVSRGHARIPVRVWTEPGGDEEIIYLLSGGAGKGLFRADLETRLGTPAKNDRILQLTGKDTIRCDYTEAFKKEFKDIPLPDAEIRIAADAKLDISSSKIFDEEDEGFSKKLEREAKGDEEDKRKSLGRPKDQIKPGNLLYLRVVDPDRDISDKPDTVTVKLTSASGDQVQVTLTETGPHTGIFEGTAKTGELPAGALATNTALDHSPLMAIDKDKKTYWLSEPDGITPKILTIDMKDLKAVDRITVSTPDPTKNAPVRGTLEGSDDGRLWFKLASNPVEMPALPPAGEFGRMTLKLYDGLNSVGFSNWNQVLELAKTGKPTKTEVADNLSWTRAMNAKQVPMTAIWQGKLVQTRPGAARLAIKADLTAIYLDKEVVLPVGAGNRTVDVYLEKGTHDLLVFAAINPATPGIDGEIFRADNNVAEITPIPFKESDFDLNQPEAKTAAERKPAKVTVKDADWDFTFPKIDLRYVRLVIHEYKGEAVAINHVEIQDTEKKKVHLPTDADLLSLANNDILEIAGGDVITAAYIDEVNTTGASRLLTATLRATYHNGSLTTIGYDFVKTPNGEVINVRKELLRVDPGERLIIEVTDYDLDRTAKQDEVKVYVQVNDGKEIELTATETLDNSGIFTREVDTSAKDEEGKLKVKPGDRIRCWYVDEQNTLPGHSVKREKIVYVNEPSEGRLRIIETRVTIPKEDRAQPIISYLPQNKEKKMAGIAFLAPMTVEVIDKDAAKDSNSKVIVTLTTTDGAKVEVECVLDDRPLDSPNQYRRYSALEEGRFTGQVILQLGGKDSPSLVPLTADMPRNLIGGPKMPKEEGMEEANKTLTTRVLNISGKDVITATYIDVQNPKEPGVKLTAQGRMITDGQLQVMDSEYQKDVTAVHVGERLFLRVVDADLDVSDKRDKAKVLIRTKRGEEEIVELEETLAHSGVFTGSVTLKPSEKPTPRNLKQDNPEIECYFGDVLELVYIDELSSSNEGPVEIKLEVKVVIGTDGKLSAFSKRFADENLAVETRFFIAESHFELFKSHKQLARDAEAKADLEAGRKILREVMEDYPNPKYAPRVAYLLGQFAQELKEHKEAIEAYQLIVKVYPDHALAPDAQFKLAQCYEEAGEFNSALDAYVTLAATYPKNPLIANVMLRISDHFYKEKQYKVAAQVCEKFLERFEGHKWAPKMAFRVGQCYHQDKEYGKAGEAFESFTKKFNSDALAADAMFWAGESYRMGNQLKKAFTCYNKCRWDHQASDAAKYARGRLALPEMLRLFEEEANLDNK